MPERLIDALHAILHTAFLYPGTRAASTELIAVFSNFNPVDLAVLMFRFHGLYLPSLCRSLAIVPYHSVTAHSWPPVPRCLIYVIYLATVLSAPSSGLDVSCS